MVADEPASMLDVSLRAGIDPVAVGATGGRELTYALTALNLLLEWVV